jgi:hypothetical protein
MLTKLILQSGLPEADFSRTPATPRPLVAGKMPGAIETGWQVQGDGPLMSVINLLFLLQQSPYLHRLENLVISPGDAPGRVKVGFRFLTLVIKPAPAVEPIDLAQVTLDSPARRVFDTIVQRDILRPYIKAPPPPPAPRSAPAARHAPVASGVAPGPESLKVVSLSQWQGQAEVHVRDLVNERTIRYKPGDVMAGGTIVLVDERPLPSQSRPGFRSDSRVILQVGAEYWAIELGRTLAEKFKLPPEQVPESLSKL